MARKFRILLTFILMMVAASTVHSQNSYILNGYIGDVSVDTVPSGWLYDDGRDTANCSDGWGMIYFYQELGDTLVLTGDYDFRNPYSYLEIISGTVDTVISGTGTLNLSVSSSYSVCIQWRAQTVGDEVNPGFAVHFESRPSTCSNPLGVFSVDSYHATNATVSWLARYWNMGPYLVNVNGTFDTVATNTELTLNNLSRNTHYHLTVVARPDSGAANCAYTLDFTTDTCDEPLSGLWVIDKGSDWVRLGWTTLDYVGPYRVTWAGHDTLVATSECLIEGLAANTDYTFGVVSMLDADCEPCLRQVSARTRCYQARVNGQMTLIGNTSVTLTADPADAYLWSTGATTQSITVSTPGYYWLVVFTNANGGCTDTLDFGVSDVRLDIDIDVDEDLCAGESMDVLVGMGRDALVRVNPGDIASMADAQRIFLPDGIDCDPSSDHGCSYRSVLDFAGFGNHQLMTDPSDIRYVMLNMEHSYVGDLYINLTCPNGQNADILRFSGNGTSYCTSNIGPEHRGWTAGDNCGGCWLGAALDEEDSSNLCDSTLAHNQAGTGWRYCWSNSYEAGYTYADGDAKVYRRMNSINVFDSVGYYIGTAMDSSNVAAGTNFYHPDQNFEALLGCPMNGEWYIEVIDGWGNDNGYIFGWELALNPNRLQRNSYQPSVASAALTGAYFSRVNDTLFAITCPANLAHDTTVTYTVTITDDDGNQFDTTFTVSFHPQRTRNMVLHVVENDMPLTLYGQSFADEVENYVITVPMPDGCDSTILLTLDVAENVTMNFDTTICSDQLPLLWHGYTYTAAAIRVEHLNTWQGADSLVTHTLTVQPSPTITACNDVVIPAGTPATLTVTGNADYWVWTDSVGNIVGSGPSISVSPLAPTRYYATGYSAYAESNIITNGDFEQGNTGFTTDYMYSTNLSPDGRYCVGPNAGAMHPDFIGSDHTSGHGNFFVANGAGTPGTTVWQQVVPVTSNTDYAFGAWLLDVVRYSSSAAVMQFSINGVQLGNTFRSQYGNGWTHFYEVWNSGSSTTATITILNQNTTTGGNDFGLDDLFFGSLMGCSSTDSVLVEPVWHVTADTTICSTQLPLMIDGIVCPAAGSYTYTLVSSMGADSIVTYNLAVVPAAAATITGVRDLVGTGDAVTLTAGVANSYLWSTGDTSRSITVTESGYYTLVVNGGLECADTATAAIGMASPEVVQHIVSPICASDSLVVVMGVAEASQLQLRYSQVGAIAITTAPQVASAVLTGPYVAQRNDSTFVINAPATLVADTTATYTATITDAMGNTYTATFTVTFTAGPQR